MKPSSMRVLIPWDLFLRWSEERIFRILDPLNCFSLVFVLLHGLLLVNQTIHVKQQWQKMFDVLAKKLFSHHHPESCVTIILWVFSCPVCLPETRTTIDCLFVVLSGQHLKGQEDIDSCRDHSVQHQPRDMSESATQNKTEWVEIFIQRNQEMSPSCEEDGCGSSNRLTRVRDSSTRQESGWKRGH